MSILAVFTICGAITGLPGSPGVLQVPVCGTDLNSAPTAFSANVNADASSYSFNADLESAVKARLQLIPFFWTFGPNDTVRLLAAHD